MEFLERKDNKLLQRLRQLQVEQCCLHIDQQIGLWYQNNLIASNTTVTSTTPVSATTTTNKDTTTTTPLANTTGTATLTTAAKPTTSEAATATTASVTPITANVTSTSTTTITSTTTTASTSPVINATTSATTNSNSITTISNPDLVCIKEEPIVEASQVLLHSPITTTPPLPHPIDVEEQTIEILDTITSSPQPPQSAAVVTTAAAPPPPPQHVTPPSTPIPHLQPHVHEEDDRTIGCFLSNIKHLESFDSDATESTSSNDSYDELEGFSHEDIPPKRKGFHPNISQNRHPTNSNSTLINANQDYSDLRKKAIWKWANERSRLASRWTWLQAQVADLEFRIRGQNDATMHARAHKTPPIPPVLPENSCSRTVPLSKDFRRRRLIKSTQILSDSNKKLVKFSHVPCICSSLPQTVAPCLSCNGRYNYLRRLEGENTPLPERISLLDPCYHPVLSFPDDLTLGSQLSYLLKQETINRKPTKGRPGRKKGSTAEKLAAVAAAAAAAAEANGVPPKHPNKFYRGMVGRPPLKNPSQTMITSNKLRRKYRKHSTNNNNNWAGTRRNKRRASSVNESSESSSNNNVVRRRRSEQSAYDIDNIVIPFSIAATTRVEVLEYKEIMTPSWRVWENGTCQSVDEEIEDTSDEAYIIRHSRGEVEEKKRFALKAVPTESK